MNNGNHASNQAIEALERWLDQARAGTFTSVAIVLVGPEAVAHEVAGEGQEFAMNFCLDHCKAEVMARFLARQQAPPRALPASPRPKIIFPGAR